ncbi:hypothetical protein PA905_05140 [Planktothrix agardhii CCAP 1459/11A]|uniref:Plasmid stabilization system n=2 Tax=Planktothrix TaxID=54304 RepID=A0A4P5ZW61_PLAAG|nr:hypothetical protein PA905_05140 [Planktothrix agardhii CCAP 1459/11A]CAD5934380.1 Putative toxin Y4kP [Planktothrix rubescens]CAH2571925.1 Putative toxin Y4kP [Planktothrix rubescens]
MKIKWLRRALRNLEILYTYISSDDADAARQTIVRIQDAVNQLAQYPFMGRYGRVEGTIAILNDFLYISILMNFGKIKFMFLSKKLEQKFDNLKRPA